MTALYRISDGGNLKNKLPFADKLFCLKNFLDIFENITIIVIADNCKKDTIDKLSLLHNILVLQTSLGNAKSWRYCVDYAIKKFDKNEIVYLVEDDYVHLPGAPKLIREGINIADYVTLYDHPDKYVDKKNGGNPFITNGGEKTKVFLTDSTHWKQTNSTTMTFAAKVKTLEEDRNIWWRHTKLSPHDFAAFRELVTTHGARGILRKKRKLISSIPGRSTHVEVSYLSPLINWDKLSPSFL